MNFSAWFIRRPIATSLLMLGILFLGVASYTQLPISGVPQVDIPTISISTQLPGASAETVAAGITAPLERALANLPGVTSLTSSSMLGSSSIDVQFELNRSVDIAAVDVQSAISAALGDLPKNLPHPPTFEKANPSDALLMTIAVYSDSLPIAAVDDYVENYLAPQISRVPGVGLVDYHGQQKPAIRVRVDPGRVAALGRTLEDVRLLIAASTVNGAKGTLNSGRTSVTLDSNDQLDHAAEYAALVVSTRDGAVTRLGDVGSVVESVENVKQSAWIGTHQAVMVDVHKQEGFNINATVQQVRKIIPALERDLPASVHLTLLGDRTQTIRASVRDVQFTLLITCALVVLVVYSFLGSGRATLIPAVTIPLSLFGSMGVMYILGYSLDNVSLMALTISVGFIVDDAVVMLENVLRHVEHGEDSLTAALSGSREIGFTVVSMTVSLVAVFIPVLFMGGVVGRLFREFAGTATVAILISGLVSLTLTPVLCARWLRPEDVHSAARIHVHINRVFNRVLAAYERGLRWSLDHSPQVLGVLMLTLATTVGLYVVVPKGFFPQQDNGLIAGVTEAAPDISYGAMVSRMRALAARVREDPDIQHVYFWIEADPSTNIGRMLIDLKPFGERENSVYTVIRRIGKRVADMPDIALHLQARQDLTIGARVSKTQFQYTLRDPNLNELRHWAPIVLESLRKIPQIRDVEADIDPAAPGVTVRLDRDAMARLDVTTQAVDDTLYDAYGQRQVASYFTQLNVYRTILEVDPQLQLDENALKTLYVPSRSGLPVQLSAISRLERTAAPLTVNHDGQFPAVTLSFNLAPGAALGDAVQAVRAKALTIGTPPGLTSLFAGSAGAFQDSLAGQPFLICAALLAIYIVLGILYESYIHPLTILSTLPSAGIGGLLALMLLRYDFSLIALIGVILLIGIVKKNGIMMVDQALALEAKGATPEAAIYQASMTRFRPILMTTLVTLLAALPLAFGTGAGSELRRPLGVVMVGGLLLSQVLTLYTTPVIYLYMERLTRRDRPWRHAAARRDAAEQR
ncbi:MAG TPA: efflux RND transporter permease subunit [Steroidobacteraceae bacterium]